MIIHRNQNTQVNPYNVTFEIIEPISYKEAIIANKALSLSPFDIGRLQLGKDEVEVWDYLANLLSIGVGKEEEHEVNIELLDLKRIGSGLMYFVDTSDEEMSRYMSNNNPNKSFFPTRRTESIIAEGMVELIKNRNISVSRLWTPEPTATPVGFARR